MPPPPPPSPLLPMQARSAAGCSMRYLGASPNCTFTETGMFAIGSSALLKWQLIRN